MKIKIEKRNINPVGYYLVLRSMCGNYVVEGHVMHNGDQATEVARVNEAKELMNKAIEIGVEGIKNESEQKKN